MLAPEYLVHSTNKGFRFERLSLLGAEPCILQELCDIQVLSKCLNHMMSITNAKDSAMMLRISMRL